ncbi:hypothetical protein Taro_027581 [Colocasia esculenta]|uniref:Uncharacterized protein n=1 Tax=Colocasia esculenta TaxID=4460 RepID=A0A843VEX7_COLES|nr:hypothetical protein [Colocasia esculenta]
MRYLACRLQTQDADTWHTSHKQLERDTGAIAFSTRRRHRSRRVQKVTPQSVTIPRTTPREPKPGLLQIAERMTQMMTPSLQSDDAAPVSAEDAFIAVMGRDRRGRVRCTGKAETLHTWYGRGEGSSSSGGYHTQVQ